MTLECRRRSRRPEFVRGREGDPGKKKSPGIQSRVEGRKRG